MKTILVDAVDAFVSNKGKIFIEMQELLDSYQNRKIILTGAPYEKFSEYNLDHMPYEVFTLQHNPPKIQPTYYETMLTHFNLSAEDVVYFEHAEEAVRSARSVGINTFHYDAEKRDLTKLKAFLDLNL